MLPREKRPEAVFDPPRHLGVNLVNSIEGFFRLPVCPE
jgi:hypothetical protein